MANFYNPYQQYGYYPQNLSTYPQNQQQQQPMQIQNGGFISVRGETEARNYPVAPGNSVTFKDELAPYVYTKTMGFSQLDRPTFEKYRLVKEDTTAEGSELTSKVGEGTEPINDTIEDMKSEIKAIWAEIEVLKNVDVKSEPKQDKKRGRDGGNGHDKQHE